MIANKHTSSRAEIRKEVKPPSVTSTEGGLTSFRVHNGWSAVCRVMVVVVAAGALWVATPSATYAAETQVDSTVFTTNSSTLTGGPTAVWVSSSTAYTFYLGVEGDLEMASTTNAGTSWGVMSNVDSVNTTDVVNYAIWWDGWTQPGTTTEFIHVVTSESGGGDTYYTRVNALTGTTSTSVLATDQSMASTRGSDSYVSITKTPDNVIYMTAKDTSDSFVVSCASDCTNAGNWSERTGAFGSTPDLGDDYPYLMPIPGTNNVLLTYWDISADTIDYNVYSATSSSWWFTTPVTLATTKDDNTTYDAQLMSMALATTTGVVMLALVDDANDYTTQDHDINIYTYASTTGWTGRTNVVTTATGGLTGVKLSYDPRRNTWYAVYTRRTTIGTNTTTRIYYRTSTNNGSSWSAEQGPIGDNADDLNGLTTNMTSVDRLGVWWNYTTAPRADQEYYTTLATVLNPFPQFSLLAGASTSSVTMTGNADAPYPLASYFFTATTSGCGSDAGTGGTDSGWQASATYLDTGLQLNKCYGYMLSARDVYGNVGTSSTSTTYSLAATPTAPTITNPTGSTLTLTNGENNNPTTTPTTLYAYYVASTSPEDTYWQDKYVSLTSVPSSIPSWSSDTNWDYSGGFVLSDLNPETEYTLVAVAKNGSGVLTGTSTASTGTTTAATPAATYRVSGTLYSDEGTTEYTTGGKTIALKVDGTGSYSTTTRSGSGAWYLDGIPVATSSVLTVWVDDTSVRGAVVTIASSSATTTGLSLYQNRVILRTESTTTPLTIEDIDIFDSDIDANIPFTATTTATTTKSLIIPANTKLYVWPNAYVKPDGPIVVQGNAGASPDGDVHIADGARLSMYSSLSLAGNLSASSTATILWNSPRENTITFTATTSGKKIAGSFIGTNALPNVVFNGVGGSWSFSDNAASTSAFTIATGTVTAPAYLTIAGNYTNTGTFTHNSGTVYLSKTGLNAYLGGDMTGTNRFHNVEVITSPTGQFASTSASSTPSYGGTIYATAIDGDFLYVGGGTTNTIRRYHKDTLAYVDASPSYGNTINALAVTDGYVYAGGGGAYDIKRYRTSDLTYVDASPSYGNNILALQVADGYVYAGGGGAYDIKRYRTSDLTYVDASPSYGNAIYALTVADGYVYAGGGATDIKRYRTSDLSYVDASPSYGNSIRALAVADGYVYAGGAGAYGIKRYRTSDLSYVDASPSYGNTINALTVADGYVYAGGDANDIKRYRTSDLTYVDASPSYGNTINALAVTDGYVYAGGGGAYDIKRYRTSDLTYVDASPSYGNNILALQVADGYVYAGVYDRIKRYRMSDLNYVDQSTSYGSGGINRLVVSDNYVYALGSMLNVVKKYSAIDLAYITSGPWFGGPTGGLAVEDGYVYVSGFDGMDEVVKKYHASDLTTLVYNSNYFNSVTYALAIADSFLYVGGGTDGVGYYIRRFRTSDLSYVDQSPSYSNIIRALTVADGYVYAGGDANDIKRYRTADLSYVDASPSYGSSVNALQVADGYVYAGGLANDIKRYRTSDLSYVDASPSYGNTIYALTVADGSVYAGGLANDIKRYAVRTAATLATSTSLEAASLTIRASSTLDSGASSSPITLTGNWVNEGGTFIPRTGTTTFVGPVNTITGTTTFYNLAKVATTTATTTFGAGATYTVSGTWQFTGPSTSTPHNLRSSVDGAYWYINPQGTRILTGINVKDSYNQNVVGIYCHPSVCTDAGHTVNWLSYLQSISGSLYSDAGQTPYTTAGKTLTLKAGGFTYATTTGTGGTYLIPDVALATGTVAILYADNDATYRAAVLTVASSSRSIQNLDLYQNRVILRTEATSTTLTLATLNTYDKDTDTDIPFRVATTSATSTLAYTQDAGIGLYLSPATTLRADGPMTLHGNASTTPDGDFHLATSSAFMMQSTLSLAGSLTAAASTTFTYTSPQVNTITFTATTTGKTIDGPFTATSSLPNLTFTGVGGSWTFAQNATTGSITIATGTVSAPQALSLNGSYQNTGTFLHNNGTVYFTKEGTAATLAGTMTGSSSFNNVVVATGEGTADGSRNELPVLGRVDAIATDDTAIYFGSTETGRVRKYDKRTYEYLGQTPVYGFISEIIVSGDYLYVGGAGVTRYNKHTLEYVDKTLQSWTFNDMAIDTEYIYLSYYSWPYYGLMRIQKSDLSIVNTVPNVYDGTVWEVEVDDAYVYIGGSVTNTVKRFNKSSMTYVDQTPNFGSEIYALKIDDSYIYVGGRSVFNVRRYNKATLAYVDQTPSYGGTVYAVEVDTNYVYVGGYNTNTTQRFRKTDLGYVDQTPSFGATIRDAHVDGSTLFVSGVGVNAVRVYDSATMAYKNHSSVYGGTIYSVLADSNYLYVSGATTNTLRRYSKSTLAYIDQTASYGGQVNAVAYDANYIYLAGATTNTIRRYNRNTLAYVDQTATYGGTINAIAVDDTYLYVGGATTNTVRRYLKSTMAYVNETATYGGTIQTVVVSGNYIYAAGATTLRIRKYDKTNMTLLAQSASYGGTINTLAVDGDYILAAGATTLTVRRYRASDLLYVDQSPSYGAEIRAIAVDGPYLYATGLTTDTVRRYRVDTLAYLDQSPRYGGAMYALTVDNGTVYAAGATMQTVRRYPSTSFTYEPMTPTYGGTVYAVATDPNYIYVGGATTNTVRRYRKDTMAYVDQTASYGGQINAIAVDDTYLYVAGVTTNTVRRYNKSTMAYIDQTATYGGTINAITLDASYLYAAGATTNTVRRYNRATLAYIDQTPSYGGTIQAIAVSGDYLYAGGASTSTVRRYTKNTLAYVGQSPAYGGTINSIAINDKYVFAGGASVNAIRQYTLSDLALATTSASYGGEIRSIVLDGDYAYAAGLTQQSIYRYDVGDLIFDTKWRTPAYLGNFYALALDGTSLYAAGSGVLTPVTQYDTHAAAVLNTSMRIDGTLTTANRSVFSTGSSTNVLEIRGNFTNVGTYTSTQGQLQLFGNFTNAGTFNAGQSTTTLTGTSHTLTGDTTFHHLVKQATTSATTTFSEGDTFTVTGNLVLTGISSTTPHALRSSSSTVEWYLDPQGSRTLTGLDVRDSYNLNALPIRCPNIICIDSGNNTGWLFYLISLSGTLYTDEGSTQYTTAGKTISLRTGGYTYATTTAAGTGVWRMDDVAVATDTALILWTDNDATLRSALVTLATSTYNNLSNLSLYQNRVILRTEGTTTPLTIEDTDIYDSDIDADIPFRATTTATATKSLIIPANTKLYVWPESYLKPGGPIVVYGNAGATPDGDVHIGANSTLSMDSTLSLAGNLTASSGVTFRWNSPRENTVTFTATTSGKKIAGSFKGSNALPNIVFNGVGGSWNFSENAASTSAFTIASGTVRAPTALTVQGSFVNLGTFISGTGTVQLEQHSGPIILGGVMTDTNRFHDLSVTTNSSGTFASSTVFAQTPSYGSSIIVAVADDRYLYVGGYTTNAVRRYDTQTLAFVDEFASSSSPIDALALDDQYVYVGSGYSPSKVTRYERSTLLYAGETATSTQNIRSIVSDGQYVYVASGEWVVRYLHSTLALDSAVLITATDLVSDNQYLYTVSQTGNTVRKYDRETMELITASQPYNGQVTEVVADKNYLYVVGWGGSGSYIARYEKNTLQYIDRSEVYDSDTSAGGARIALDDTYVYVGGGGIRTIKRFRKDTLTYVDEGGRFSGADIIVGDSNVYTPYGDYLIQIPKTEFRLPIVEMTASYGGNIWALAQDNQYIYVGGETTNTIRRYQKDTLLYVDESPSYGGWIGCIAVDDTYVYAAGETTNSVRRYAKSNLTFIDETPSYGDLIRTIAFDGLYLYAAGLTTNTVRRYRRDTLEYVDETPSYGEYIRTIALDNEYIYAAGNGTNVMKFRKDTMEYVTQSASYGDVIRVIVLDDTYVYVGGFTTNTVQRYLKSTLSFVDETPVYGDTVSAIAVDSNYIYVGGWSLGVVRRYRKSDLAYVDETPYVPGNINTILLDVEQTSNSTQYLYTGRGTTGSLAVTRHAVQTPAVINSPLGVGRISITTSSTLDAGASSSPITVYGDWVNEGGTFIPRTSTTTFVGENNSITGTTTFYNLAKVATSAATTTFGAGSTYTIDGTWTFQGAGTTSLHKLRSSVPGEYWYVAPNATRTLNYLDVQDSYNTSGTSIDCYTIVCADSGHNENWQFIFFASDADQTFYLGEATTTLNTITIIEGLATSTIRTATDIRISIATSSTNFRFDADGSLSFGGTAATKVSTSYTLEDNGATIVLNVTEDFAAGDSLTIDGIDVGTFLGATQPSSRLMLYTDGNSTGTPTAYDLQTVSIGTALALADHTGGQVSNQFLFLNGTDAPFFSFALTPSGEYATVTALTLSLSAVHNVTDSRLTNIRLYRDTDSDATLSGGDVLLGNGTLAVSGYGGTITFTDDFLATTTNDYLVVADLANISYANVVTIDLTRGGITGTGVDTGLPLAVIGSVTPAEHYRGRAKVTGGGRSDSTDAIGGAAPTGTVRGGGSRGGGTPELPVGESGDTIGAEPGYFAPTASGYKVNQWTNGTSSLVSDGSYATAGSDGLAQSYSVYTFGIPGSNSVTGILVKLEASASSAGGTLEFALSWDGGNTYTVSKTTSALTTTDTVYTLGTESDTWGRSWTPLEFTDGTFHVRVIAHPNSNTVRIDALQVKPVHITTGGSKGDSGGGAI